MYKFFIYFIGIQLVLFAIEQTNSVHQTIIIPFTEMIAHISVWLVMLFDEGVISQGVILQQVDTGFSVSIQSGCNGVEAVLVLIAAILAFPSPWKFKLWGIITGFFAVELLNIVRIISLFYLGQWNQDVFEWAHLYIWQALIMLDVLIVFLLWLRLLPAKHGVDVDATAN
ncbi:exosortase H [Methylococcaceae bacterium CS1]|nr:exosortase H [Methyloprofundus sp.]TXK97543.1 exosortase H [Methylococcaceae bacterium CS4]TXK97639.1 exosortase H [Methylococcaceae bacterium CS5]TXL05393.1 exosortase H [Methylococcaceae bacterium CS3]TXL05710.1 exosortase H [Methylococcaceae bacterium CS1]TXL09604.1 exosortase H [Methylococcaceae bacterium CS2]